MERRHTPETLREAVFARANQQCEYCGIAAQDDFFRFHIDHVIALKHGGQTELDNLALACAKCNIRKGTDLTTLDPQTGSLARLFNPRTDVWSQHFALADGLIEGVTPIGRATAYLLQFNESRRLEQRRELIASGQYLPPADAKSS